MKNTTKETIKSVAQATVYGVVTYYTASQLNKIDELKTKADCDNLTGEELLEKFSSDNNASGYLKAFANGVLKGLIASSIGCVASSLLFNRKK